MIAYSRKCLSQFNTVVVLLFAFPSVSLLCDQFSVPANSTLSARHNSYNEMHLMVI